MVTMKLISLVPFLIFIINVFSEEFKTVFDGIWRFEHEDRSFRLYVCSIDEENIYIGLTEIWVEDNMEREYTIGVSYFDRISESDQKVVMASSKSYVLAPKTDKNKNGYFDSIFVLRYEKDEDKAYIHFKLQKKSRPTNIVMIKYDYFEEYIHRKCWIPFTSSESEKIHSEYPQVWKEYSDEFELDHIPMILTRKKAKSGCFGNIDDNNIVSQQRGGYLSSIELKYDDKLMLTKWFNVGAGYKNHPCQSGTALFMIVDGNNDNDYFAILSAQCNDGKRGHEYVLKLDKTLYEISEYQCPILTAPKTDL